VKVNLLYCFRSFTPLESAACFTPPSFCSAAADPDKYHPLTIFVSDIVSPSSSERYNEAEH